jgi:t-SNARE complex subunit (syntaxin)
MNSDYELIGIKNTRSTKLLIILAFVVVIVIISVVMYFTTKNDKFVPNNLPTRV